MILLDDIYVSGGFLKDPQLQRIYTSYKSSNPRQVDSFWIGFHQLLQLRARNFPIENSELIRFFQNKSRITGHINKLTRLIQSYCPKSLIERILPSIEDLYYHVNPVHLPLDSESRLALEACVGRAIEGIKASLILHDQHLIDCFTCLGGSLEALLKFQYIFTFPSETSNMMLSQLSEQFNTLIKFRNHYKAENIVATEHFIDEIKDLRQRIIELGGQIRDEKAIQKENWNWTKLLDADEISSAAFSNNKMLTYVEIMNKRNYVAHSMPGSWESFVKMVDQEITILPQQGSVSPDYPIHSLQVFGKLMKALQLIRLDNVTEQDADYELLSYMWMCNLESPESRDKPYFQSD